MNKRKETKRPAKRTVKRKKDEPTEYRRKSSAEKQSKGPPILIAFNKPFQVLSQFSSAGDKRTLKDFIKTTNVYPAGRLDYDSEGLLLLTNHGPWQAKLADPEYKLPKTYWAQVEGIPEEKDIERMRQGLDLKTGRTLPAKVNLIEHPKLWDREPPIRSRLNVPTSWLEITIKEGKNRQVRHMTAAIGAPTLRLVRVKIGAWSIDSLKPGKQLRLGNASQFLKK